MSISDDGRRETPARSESASPDGELSGPDRPDGPGQLGGARWRRLGLVLVGLEAVVPAGAALYGLAQVLTGEAVVVRNELMLVATLLVAAGGLSMVAWGIARGRRSVRIACLVWQVLLVLGVVPALWNAGGQGYALGVLAFAVLTGYASVRATASE